MKDLGDIAHGNKIAHGSFNGSDGAKKSKGKMTPAGKTYPGADSNSELTVVSKAPAAGKVDKGFWGKADDHSLTRQF